MISKPLNWVNRVNTYYGSYYRQDLYNYQLVQASGIYPHDIENLEDGELIENVNHLQKEVNHR
jgi:hypothetical protein